MEVFYTTLAPARLQQTMTCWAKAQTIPPLVNNSCQVSWLLYLKTILKGTFPHADFRLYGNNVLIPADEGKRNAGMMPRSPLTCGCPSSRPAPAPGCPVDVGCGGRALGRPGCAGGHTGTRLQIWNTHQRKKRKMLLYYTDKRLSHGAITTHI